MTWIVRFGLVSVALITFGCVSDIPAIADKSDAEPVGSGCADGTDDQVYRADMVGCDGSLSQCEAETLCSPEWHLCTYAEYVARGGSETRATENRWLRACIRETGVTTTTCPTDLICNTCGTSSLPSNPATWDCAGNVLESAAGSAIGVLSGKVTPERKPGCPDTDCSYASVSEAFTPLGGNCCR
jgi:hypothetical protein